MKISTKGRYALRLMVSIANHDTKTPINIKEIAKEQDISMKYLERIVALLVKAGYVKSLRGAKGGYVLNGQPKDLTVGMILKVTEGSLAPVFCVDGNCESCDRQQGCPTYPLYQKLYQAVSDVVDNTTLEDLINNKLV